MDNIQILQECYSRITLIPVIGSGLSIPMGLPDWSDLIKEAADHFLLSDEKKGQIYQCLVSASKHGVVTCLDIPDIL